MLSLEHFFVMGPEPDKLVSGQYDPSMVALSLVIAIGASYMALTLAAAARRSQTSIMQRLHLISGSISLGLGIWSMHFIGMLAFQMPTHVHYHPGITALSAGPSLVASWVTLSMLSRYELTGVRLIVSGLTVGAGVGAMHYLGMAAMEIGPSLRYDPALFTISLVVAVALGTLALWVSFGLRYQRLLKGYKRRLLAGIIMGLAIGGVHYIAMEAARFIGTPSEDIPPGGQSHMILALVIAFITMGFSLLAASVNALARYRSLFRHSRAVANELRATMGAAVDGIIKISDQGIVLSFNESAEHILGYRAEEVIGRNIKVLMPNPYRDAHDDYLANYLRTGECKIIGTGRRVEALHKDGHQVPVRLAIGEARTDGQSIFVGFLTDISERVRMENELRQAKEEAEQAAEAKSRFLANMSHEIRTPMNAIIGFTDLLLETSLDRSQKKHLDIIKSSASTLLIHLNDILDTAKLDGRHTVLEDNDFSLHDLCEQIVASQSLDAHRKGLYLELDYQAPEFFRGDSLRIQQVILNLLSNAVKFTNSGGVTLKVRQPRGHGVILEVIDTGIGIDADRIDTIFEPFVQADASMARRFGGTGLGTTIARQLTELMGGRITVNSTPGVGTSFHLDLPILPGRTVITGSTPDHEMLLPSLTILVVDDVPQNLELLKILFETREHEVVTAGDGDQAVKYYKEQFFDVVLMDVQMPGMNGHEATQAIRQYEAGQNRPRTPVIALTASVLEDDRRAAIAADMDGFAIKPINISELIGEIASQLGLQAITPKAMAALDAVVVDETLIDQLWPSRAAHLRAAKEFLLSPQSQPDTLRQESVADMVRERTHRMRGTSANLGFTELAQALAAIELTLKRDEPVSALQWEQLTNRFSAAFQWFSYQSCDLDEKSSKEVALLESADLDQLIVQLSQGELPDQAPALIDSILTGAECKAAIEALDDFEPEKVAQLLIQYRDTR